ncbi:exosortase system-associated protein, TIGR04073 family [Candidatus Omnitrophota bacterium]
MPQHHKRFFIITIALFLLTLTFLVGTLFSAEEPTHETQEYTYWNKLGRGTGNLVTSVFEIPQQLEIAWKEYSYVGGTAIGLVKGVGLFLARTGVAIYETLTFPIEKPVGFEPIMDPEFVFNRNKHSDGIQYDEVALDSRRHYPEPGTKR